jgi:hypothetical protein
MFKSGTDDRHADGRFVTTAACVEIDEAGQDA